MFVRRYTCALILGFALLAVALVSARPSRGADAEARHVVRPGETLWALAAARYPGDPRAAVWRIEQRNGLTTGLLQPGTVLYLPP
ncbi:MAG TPA: LysM peptidoglycan-binding domain-containing protein [Gaiellaceae bacterium]|nr:LysM peptidoglycan-binding domain-containing protein [Gaiellaceae bacterium]